MNPNEEKTANCQEELIHLLGRVQAHGVLLGLDPESLEILRVSETVVPQFGIQPSEVLGTNLVQWIESESVERIRAALGHPSYTYNNPISIPFATDGEIYLCDGVAHLSGDLIILELEKPQNGKTVPSPSGVDEYFRLTSSTLQAILPEHSVEDIAGQIARDIKEFTEFDRVMVYRFDADFNGSVIAEAREDSLEPFLGLHYPASDIPPQARELYKRSWLRIIRSAHDEGLPILAPAGDEVAHLDLSHSTLRSVSPVHLQYLRNMGVEASMSISLLTADGDLWGLIACHHYSGEKFIPYSMRAACTHYSLVVSSRLTERERSTVIAEKAARRKALPEAIRLLFEGDDIQQGLITNSETFLSLLQADGIAVVENDWVEVTGSTPPVDDVIEMLQKMEEEHGSEPIVALDELGPGDGHCSAGVLRIYVSRNWQVFVFRNEFIHSVRWGGDPSASAQAGPGKALTPRASFEAFTEEVRGHSREWSEGDQGIAEEFRSSLATFVIHRNQHLSKLNAELSSRNAEIQQFAYSVSHDLKSPLVTVNGYIKAIEEDLADGEMGEVENSLGRVKSAVGRMGDLIEDLLTFSSIGKHEEKPQRLKMAVVFEILDSEFRERFTERGLALSLPESPACIDGIERDIARVFQNLVENAAKYMPADTVSPSIEITCEVDRREVVYKVRDNGGGIAPEYHERIFRLFERLDQKTTGSGVGLATVAKIVEQHRGKIAVESELGQGATFVMTFPKSKLED
ncbi:ATP-binding protein [bacterium]|nr:ATP-binding protein [bacterium]